MNYETITPAGATAGDEKLRQATIVSVCHSTVTPGTLRFRLSRSHSDVFHPVCEIGGNRGY